jgi:uncharacterized membrane protein
LSVVPTSETKGWTFALQTRWEATKVKAVTLLPEEPDDSVTLQFVAVPPEDVAPGAYEFTVQGESFDSRVRRLAPLVVEVKESEEVVVEQAPAVDITADYPSIEAQAGENFQFVVKVKNNAEEPVVFSLGAEFPPAWRGYVTPRWQEEKRISSIEIGSNVSETLLFTLIPPIGVEQGTYPVKFLVRSGALQEEISLSATITGTYELMVGTETGRYNVETTAGEEQALTLFVWNQGSAPIEEVGFFALNAPQDWQIVFSPEKIGSLPSYEVTKKPERIRISITTPPRTLPGDYVFTIRAVGEQDQNQKDIRVTVKRSTVWGWAGIVIVVVIIVALIVVFTRLGRR